MTSATPPPSLPHDARKEGRRFARFLVVGSVGFVVDFTVFNLAHALGFGTWVARGMVPSLLPQPEIIEQTLSLIFAIGSNFLWTWFWIYPEARGANQAHKMLKFVLVSVTGLVVGVPVFSVALLIWRSLLPVLQLEAVGLNLAGNLALVTRVGLLLFWNFFINRYWTYREVR